MAFKLARKLALPIVLVVLALGAGTAHAADPLIAAAGDIACSTTDAAFAGGAGTATACRQKYTSDLVVGGGYDSVLLLGDVQYEHGELANFQNSYDLSWGRFKPITRPAMGNHERAGDGYFDYFNGVGVNDGPAGQRGAGYYSFDIGTWHVIALNNSEACTPVPCAAGSAQEQWLRADLAAHPTQCTLAYFHEPFFSSNVAHWSGVAFWNALYEYGADVVLTGHVHNYERFAPMTPSRQVSPSDGIRQFVVGTGGRGLRPFPSATATGSEARIDNAFGVLDMTLRPSGYDWRFLTEPAGVGDSGSANCHDAPKPPPPPPAGTGGGGQGSPGPGRGRRVPGHNTRCTLVGTLGDDRLIGTRRRDVICALAGDDVVRGGGGNDLIVGGAGSDRLHGGPGRDRLFGGRGPDRIVGGAGIDRLLGNGGDDVLLARDGRAGESVNGGKGRDRATVDPRDLVSSVRLPAAFR